MDNLKKPNLQSKQVRQIGVKSIRHLMALVSLFLVMSLGLAACSSSDLSGSSSTNGSNNTSVTNAPTNGSSNSTGSNSNNNAGVNTSFNNGSTSNGTNPGANGVNGNSDSAATQGSTSNQTQAGLANPTGNLEQDIPNVVNKVKQAVVLITVETDQGEAAGTGSIVTSDGYIITNYHVVDGATSITVVLFSGQRLSAKLVLPAPYNDLAVIKINGSNFPTIPMGTTTNLQVGQWVVAIGNALALKGSPTVTAGIVGALGRSIQEPAPTNANLTGLVQTNAAINPGNSGGPLVNLQGQIVGINTAAPVDPESGTAAQGIGFAIPIDQAKTILQSAINGSPLQRPYLGVQPEDMSAGLAARYNLPTDTGVLITSVVNGSPAAKAGWKSGDIITELGGTQVTSLADLSTVLGQHKPGDSVDFTVVTPQGQQQKGNITFGQYPSTQG